jgi:hypothetical protein
MQVTCTFHFPGVAGDSAGAVGLTGAPTRDQPGPPHATPLERCGGADGRAAQLVRRRGAGAARIDDRIASIELVFDDPQPDSQRPVGRLEPPQWRRWELSENEIVIREHL